MIDAIRYAQRCLDVQGYIVMRWHEGPAPLPKVGDVIRESVGRVPGPFVIVAESSREEYLRQLELLGRVPDPMGDLTTLAYFRVMAE